MYYYEIEVRDSNGKLFTNQLNLKVTNHDWQKMELPQEGDKMVQFRCERIVDDLQTICKDGCEINVYVTTHNTISRTYSPAFSYYGKEKRFVEHK